MNIKRFIFGLTLLSLMACVTVAAQGENKEKVQIRVHYTATYHRFAEQKRAEEAEAILDIGSHTSHFYGLHTFRRLLIREQVLARGGTVGDVLNACEREGYFRSTFTYQIWKNYPTFNQLTLTEQSIKHLRYTEPMLKPEWTLVPKDSIIAGYQCQQATTDYRGRHWTVWFTPAITYSDGPWMLYGLPGLILHAEESEGLFAFSCIEIERVENEVLHYPNRKYVECTRQEYRDYMKLLWKSPDAAFEKLTGFRSKGWDQNGKEIVRPERVAIFIDKE